MNAATIAGALGALGMLLPAPAQAGAVEHGFSLALSGEYDTNPGLAAAPADGLWRVSALPAYSLTRAAGPDEWSGRLALRLERASDAALSADRQDPSLSLAWKRARASGGAGLSYAYEKAASRETEFQDTGLVSVDGSRTSQTLGADWNESLDERRGLAANASLASVRYARGGLTDHDTLGAGLTYSHAWSERNEPYLRAAWTRYEPRAGGAASDSWDLLAGVRLRPSERLDLEVSAGLNRTVAASNRSGWQGGLKLNYEGDENTRLSLDLGRGVASSGSGGFTESDRLTASWDQALSERWNLGASLAWRKSRAAGTGDTLQFNLSGSRALSDAWSLRLAYTFRQREGAGLPEASGHLLGVTLSYAHPDFLDL